MPLAKLAIAACAAALLAGCAATHHDDAADHGSAASNRIVIQVSDNDAAKWNLALNNARNVQKDFGRDNVQIEIVAYGPGLNMVKAGSAVAPRIEEAVLSGIRIDACENTMANTRVGKDQILPGVAFVGSGVVQIMKRQQEGWSYLRP